VFDELLLPTRPVQCLCSTQRDSSLLCRWMSVVCHYATVDAGSAINRFAVCASGIEAWLWAIWLHLNLATCSILIWYGSHQQFDKTPTGNIQLLVANLRPLLTVSLRDLGVVIDSRLTMADHVSIICQSGYFHLSHSSSVSSLSRWCLMWPCIYQMLLWLQMA